jgi:hypothetical protein
MTKRNVTPTERKQTTIQATCTEFVFVEATEIEGARVIIIIAAAHGWLSRAVTESLWSRD